MCSNSVEEEGPTADDVLVHAAQGASEAGTDAGDCRQTCLPLTFEIHCVLAPRNRTPEEAL